MALDAGTRLGAYEIFAPIGAGGMGEVNKARDTRLDRTVAIKVLPSHLADHPELRERFEREARAASSLNHPNICTLHDVGSQDGVDFIVMEHLDGESLADRLTKGALPLDKAFRYAVQIAEALDKAHRAGIVHRDLKPGNVMLTKLGAKLLDFGLAKIEAASAGDALSALPTKAKPLTEKGTVLGTFQYMAPEQLDGGEADARTDVFAFGAVLYEMVSGRKAFTGKSQASLISAILRDAPPVSPRARAGGATAPRSFREAVSRKRSGRALANGVRRDARALVDRVGRRRRHRCICSRETSAPGSAVGRRDCRFDRRGTRASLAESHGRKPNPQIHDFPAARVTSGNHREPSGRGDFDERAAARLRRRRRREKDLYARSELTRRHRASRFGSESQEPFLVSRRRVGRVLRRRCPEESPLRRWPPHDPLPIGLSVRCELGRGQHDRVCIGLAIPRPEAIPLR